jgi:hypothetical protein
MVSVALSHRGLLPWGKSARHDRVETLVASSFRRDQSSASEANFVGCPQKN